jgi:hypothetical protein
MNDLRIFRPESEGPWEEECLRGEQGWYSQQVFIINYIKESFDVSPTSVFAIMTKAAIIAFNIEAGIMEEAAARDFFDGSLAVFRAEAESGTMTPKGRARATASVKRAPRHNLGHASRIEEGMAAMIAHRLSCDEGEEADLIGDIASLRSEGLSQRAIAARLNAEGHETRRGRPWNQVQVLRILRRLKIR